jgi:two-component system chemotaxis response regulator CheB
MVAARRDHRPRHPPAPGAPRVAPAGPRQAPDLVLIGTSTGGPNALARIIPQLPAALPAPVLVVQHMPPLFTSSLAEQLARKSAVAVREARHGEPLAPGTVLLAPGGRHMTVAAAPDARGPRDWQVQINDDPPVNSCRPSVDVLFQSVAAQARAAVVSVIMTGMGADGLDGVARLKRRHGYVLAQDADSCVVYGMSRAVIEKGLADEVLPLDRIGARIVELLQPEPAA